MKNIRTCWLFVSLSVMLSLPAAGVDQHRAARLGDLPTAAQPGISAALGQDLPEYHVQKAEEGFSAANPEQNLTMHFAADGAEVQRGSTRWQMTVRGYGYDGELRAVSSVPAVQVNSNRVEYRHGSLTEWYVNGPVGLEQGFTVNEPPSKKAGGALTIALSLSEHLNAALDKDGASLTMGGAAKDSGMRYTGLAAHDQTGKELHAWLELHNDQLWLKVDDAGARYPVVIDPWVQAGKLTSYDGAKDDVFGFSVGVSTNGTTIVVGAEYATVGGVAYTGAAYVFTEPTSGWGTATQSAKLVPSGAANLFGASVAVDGNTVAVGAPGNIGYQGAVYVFVEPQGGWSGTLTQSAKLTASDRATLCVLGDSISVAVNLNTGLGTVAAGSPGHNVSQGAVYVYVEPSGGWGPATENAKLLASDGKAGDALGSSVSISGNAIVAGAPSATVSSNTGAGAAYVFVEPSGGWSGKLTQTGKLTASDAAADDNFGWAISFSNNTVAAGAPYHNTGGAAYVYVEPTGGWANMTQTAELSAGLTKYWLFGAAVATNGATVAVGAPMAQSGSETGIVYGFVEPATGWVTTTTPSFTLTASDEGSADEFGSSVGINGDVLVAGSPYATVGSNLYQGAAYVFTSGVSFDGVDVIPADGGQPSTRDVDPEGAVGTKQFFEWTNANVTQGGLQAWDKVTLAPVWSDGYQYVDFPWAANNQQECESVGGDGDIIFDSQAQNALGTTGVWVIGAHNSPGQSGPYYYCVAVSNTDDLTNPSLAWYTYSFPLDSYLGTYQQNGNNYPNFPDWPKIGTGSNAYYVTLDVLYPPDIDNHQNIGSYMPLGVIVCALDRTDMLMNNAAKYQCLTDPSPIPQNPTTANLYLRHSLIPADIDGMTPPPTNRDEFLLSIQNPPFDLKTTTSTSINLWDFHLGANFQNSTLTRTSLTVPTYTPGCYQVAHPLNTFCVPQPTTGKSGVRIDSVGDRLMPRLAYRNFLSTFGYESFVVSHTVQPGASTRQTGLRWYELRDNGSANPSLYQSGTLAYDKTSWRHVPSIDEDQTGNAAIGYSVTSTTIHPSIYASSWTLTGKTKPTEFPLWGGSGDLETLPPPGPWGSYTGMSVDPVDGCTFWYVNEYLTSTQTGSSAIWNTRISNFKLPTCH